MATPAQNPYLAIPGKAFEMTFDTLLGRPDCTDARAALLKQAKEDFLNSGSTRKGEAMQALLAAYPNDTVQIMTRYVQALNTRPPAAANTAQAPPPAVQAPPAAGQAPNLGVYQAALAQAQGSSSGIPAALQPNLQLLQEHLLRAQQQNPQLQGMTPELVARALQLKAAAAAMTPPPATTAPGISGLKRPEPSTTPTDAGRLAKDLKASPLQAPGQQGGGTTAAPGAKGGKHGEEDVTAESIEEADALAGSGVNVQQEQEALLLSATTRTVRSIKDVLPRHQEELVLNPTPLQQLMTRVAQRQGLKSVDPACLTYLAMAVEAHMGRLLTAMARAAQQRHDPARKSPGGVRLQGVDVNSKLKATQHSEGGAAGGTGTSDSNAQQQQQQQQRVGGEASQSFFSFRRMRPLFVRQEGQEGGVYVGLARALDPLATLTSPTSLRPGSKGKEAGKGEAAVTMGLPDLVAALERDALLSRHPLVQTLYLKLNQSAT